MARTARPQLLAAALGLALAAAQPAAAQPSVQGSWAGPYGWSLVASHGALLATGKVLAWSDASGATAVVYDPAANTLAPVASINTNVSGSTSALLSDGDVVVLGGRLANGDGIADVHRYDAVAATWTALPPVDQERGDASLLQLGDGRLLALGGQTQIGQAADWPEVAEPGSAWIQMFDDMLSLPPRPWTLLLSNGDVLVAGPEAATRRFSLTAPQTWSAVGSMRLGTREGGAAVLVPGAVDRVLVLGGRNPATPTCEVLDLPTTTNWEYTNPMARARRYHNATLLADGSVLVTGGTLVDDALEHAVLPAEIYRPDTDTWTTLASMSVPRRRGSIALLLPDGRVLCAGGGDGSPGSETHPNAEIFSPPYLFQGARPTISQGPDFVLHGSTFVVQSAQAASIARVWLVRAGSVAGGSNPDQRAVQLGFAPGAGSLLVTAPVSPAEAPPGIWMLFLVNGAGVPSVGKLVRVDVTPPPTQPPSITSSPPTEVQTGVQYNYQPVAGGSEPFTWSLPVKPAWLAVSPSSGFVAGLPTVTGSYAVTLRATNDLGTDDQSWTIQVVAPPSTTRIIVPIGAVWKYFKGTSNPPSNWATPEFSDATWQSGPSGFGYGDGDDATVLSDMQNQYTTVFTRRTFPLYNVAAVTRLALLYDYDDGLAVYLNGTRIWARNAPSTITNISTATNTHERSASLTRQNFTDTATRSLLRSGNNVLAAVGLNSNSSSNDLTLKVALEVTGGSDSLQTDVTGAAPLAIRVQPNPFVHAASVSFGLSRPGAARLEIFDVAGRCVRTLVQPDLQPGAHALVWDGRDGGGRTAAPGVYFYRLSAPGLERRGKIARLR